MAIKTKLQQLIDKYGGEYYNIQTVRLGKKDHTLATGIDGQLWARQWNGREIRVINQAFISADFDKRVLVGRKKNQQTKWFILEDMEDYLVPVSGGRIGYHEKQHEIDNPDMLPVDRRQLVSFSLMVQNPPSWNVQFYGGVFHSATGVVNVPSALYDMSAYVNTTGTNYVSFEVDNDGVMYLVAGPDFGDPLAGSVAFVPVPPPNRYLIGYVAFYAGQTGLINNDIRVLMPLGMGGRGSGGSGDIYVWIDGALSAGTNVVPPVLITKATVIREIYLYLEELGTSGSTILDVNLNGTTVWADPADRPEIAYTDTSNWTSSPTDTVDYSQGDVLTFDLDQVAPGSAGAAIVLRVFTANEFPSAGIGRRIYSFTWENLLIVYSGTLRLYNRFGVDMTITEVFIATNVAPTGADVIIDVNKNGTTIFTTPGNRPTILDGTNEGVTTIIDDAPFLIGDYLTIDVDQIGSTTPGVDLTVHVVFE